MPKILLRLLLLGSLATITACGNTPTETEASPPESESTETITEATESASPETEEPTKEKQDWRKESSDALKVGETASSPLGEMTLVKQLEVNEMFETGSFTVDIGTIGVTKLIPNNDVKAMLDNKDEVTLLNISMQVSNTSPDTLSFHPNQGVVVVGSEQKNADIIMSNNIGGDFIGEVKKTGQVIFALDTPPEEIDSVKYVIDPPFSTENYEGDLGEKLTLEFAIE